MRWGVFLFGVVMSAQSLHVYSEFALINAAGVVTAPQRPREILSPAIVRNGFTSFQVVVEVAQGTPFWLYIGQNPEDAARVTLYRESGERLEKVEQPAQGSGTQIFWMDVWVNKDAPVRRIKIEPELNVGSEWVTYPMEARVMEATIPESAATVATVRGLVCGTPAVVGAEGVAGMHARNAQQDVALSTRVPKEELRRVVACDESPDPEAYMRIRDYLFRMR